MRVGGSLKSGLVYFLAVMLSLNSKIFLSLQTAKIVFNAIAQMVIYLIKYGNQIRRSSHLTKFDEFLALIYLAARII